MTEKTPPGPDGVPIIGAVYHYLRDPFEYRTLWADEYGDVVNMWGLGLDMYMLSHPENIQQVLVSDHDKFCQPDDFQRRLHRLLGNGLLVSEGDFWRRQRTLVQPSFHPNRIEAYAATMSEYAGDLVQSWTAGRRFDVNEQMKHVTLRILIRSLFSVDIDDAETDFGASMRHIVKRFEPKQQMVPEWLPTPTNIRYKRGIQTFEDLIERMVERRREMEGTKNDLLSSLLNAGDAETQLSENVVRDEMMTMLLAGHKTTAVALTFTWYLLAHNPEVGEKLRTELDTVLDGDPATFDDLEHLAYTEKVVVESMRLYPPFHAVLREPIEDVRVGEYILPEGSLVAMPQWVVHRDERWYDDPEQFRPERWTDEFESQQPEYAYYPFGGGPRQCLGNRFAMTEAQIILATLAQHYELELVSDAPLDLVASLATQPKNAVEMIVRERT